jgi:opacity protein-like surface antigen
MRASHFFTLLFTSAALQGADLELKSLGDAAQPDAKRKFGPYVGVSIGDSIGQSGTVKIGNTRSQLQSKGGESIVSLEVGKSWKMKRVPLMFSLDAEGTYMSSSLNDPSGLVLADMSSLMFSLNGTLALDLYRYRARIGKFAAGFRPYVGGGLGGGQVWFRNAATFGTATPFNIDEFISSWNWFAGIEWTWKDQYSVFAEYRESNFGDMQNLTGYATDGYLAGFRYRY